MDNTIKADAVIQCPQCKPKTDVCNEVLSSNFSESFISISRPFSGLSI